MSEPNIYGRYLDKELERFKSVEMLPCNKKIIEEFILDYGISGNNYNSKPLGNTRTIKLLNFLIRISRFEQDSIKGYFSLKDKDFGNLKRSDIQTFALELDKNCLAIATKNDYKKQIKVFCTWVESKRKGENTYWEFQQRGLPENVSWIKIESNPPKKYSKEELISPEDIIKMLQVSNTLMDKCLIILCYDTMGRIGEVAKIKFKDLDFFDDEKIVHIRVKGKTGERVVTTQYSYSLLKKYISSLKEISPEDYLFSNSKGELYNYNSLRKKLITAKNKAGITKRLHFHLIRKSRATSLANSGISMPLIKEQAGWSQNSRVLSVYLQANISDVDDAFGASVGKKKNEANLDLYKLLPKICPKCNKENEVTASICEYCFAELTSSEYKKEIIDKDQEIEQLKKEIELLRKDSRLLQKTEE